MMAGKKILVIDDDVVLLDILDGILTDAGYRVVVGRNGREGLRHFYREKPHLVLLDVRMPELNGWETCRQMRQMADTPIIILSALNDEKAIIRGFDLGVIDFIGKPFNKGELLARVRGALHRSGQKRFQDRIYLDNRLTVDRKTGQVFSGSEIIHLTRKERAVLLYFLENRGILLTFEQILSQVWGWEFLDNTEYVHVYVNRLRQKLERDPQNPVLIETDYGYGYRLAPATPAAQKPAARPTARAVRAEPVD